MSQQRHGGWDDLDQPAEQQQHFYLRDEYPVEDYPVTEINRRNQPRRTVRRNTGDNFREFFYWFGSNGGFRAIPRILGIIVAVVAIVLIINNRNAIFSGFMGILSEIIPIVLFLWILWLCVRGLINPK